MERSQTTQHVNASGRTTDLATADDSNRQWRPSPTTWLIRLEYGRRRDVQQGLSRTSERQTARRNGARKRSSVLLIAPNQSLARITARLAPWCFVWRNWATIDGPYDSRQRTASCCQIKVPRRGVQASFVVAVGAFSRIVRMMFHSISIHHRRQYSTINHFEPYELP